MAGRLSPLNLALMLITVLALIFGAWGVFGNGSEAGRAPLALPQTDQIDDPDAGAAMRTDATRPDRHNPRITRSADEPARQVSGAKAELQPKAATGPSDKGDAVIGGVVLRVDASPAPGVAITCRNADLELQPPSFRNGDVQQYGEQVQQFLDRTAAETRRATTDAEGRFQFAGLDPTLAYNLYAQSPDGAAGQQLRVAAGDTTRILLSFVGRFRGKVVNANGEPVTTFSIRVWAANRRWEARTEEFNSPDGTFAMEGAGRLQLEAESEGLTLPAPMDIDASSDGDEIVVRLQPAAVVSGVVTDADQNPLGNVSVTLGRQSNQGGWNYWNQDQGPRATTDSRGRFRLAGLPPGETTLRATIGDMSTTRTLHLAEGSNDVRFELDVGAVVALRLSNPAGQPVTADSIWFHAGGRNWSQGQRLAAREPGLVELAGLEPGTYTVTITAGGYPQLRFSQELQRGRNELALSLSSSAIVKGRVSGASAAALSNARVRLRREGEQNEWSGWGSGLNASIERDGTFKLGPVEPGQWVFEMTHQQGQNRVLHSSMLQLVEGDNQHEFSVDAGATLIVRVTDRQGNPLSRIEVVARGDRATTARTDAQGVATMAFLSVGSYTITASGAGMAARDLAASLANGENTYTMVLRESDTARISRVYPNSQAARAGIQEGDLILEYNGQHVTSWQSFVQAARAAREADDVSMVVSRNGAQLTISLKGGTVGIEGVDAVR